MPIHDAICRECGHQESDILHKVDEEVKCPKCSKVMELLPSTFAFNFASPGVTKFKRRYGNTVPPEYKTSGGANVYGIPRKS